MISSNQSDKSLPASANTGTAIVPFERLTRENWSWGMSQASLYFDGEGRVQQTLRRITKRLAENEIPYAVAGGMALFYHGYHRFTEDVDIVVTQQGLDRLHEAVDGLGFVRPYSTSKNLRDTETGVKIEFLITGGFPGDGKPKEVAFPNPADVGIEIGGVRFVNLPTFINLKLASGLTGEGRGKDIIDVLELIKAAQLDELLAPQLSPLVQAEYLRQCAIAKRLTRYIATEAMAPERLAAMLADGVYFDEFDGQYATRDPEIAKKYGLSIESKL